MSEDYEQTMATGKRGILVTIASAFFSSTFFLIGIVQLLDGFLQPDHTLSTIGGGVITAWVTWFLAAVIWKLS